MDEYKYSSNNGSEMVWAQRYFDTETSVKSGWQLTG